MCCDPGFRAAHSRAVRSGRSRRGPIVLAAACVLGALFACGSRAVTVNAEQWLGEAEAAYEKVETYTAIFHKQQRVGGELLREETIALKFRKPASLYLKWIKEPYQGSELVFEAGRNAGRVRAHRGGMLRFVTRNLEPKDPALMAGNLRPVTSVGIGYLLQEVGSTIRRAARTGDLRFSDLGEESVYGRATRILEVAVPQDRGWDYDECRFVINQDRDSRILLRIRVYDRDGLLIENYGYENLQLNAPLGDADFDPRNPEYHF